jgi:hypothetical protein
MQVAVRLKFQGSEDVASWKSEGGRFIQELQTGDRDESEAGRDGRNWGWFNGSFQGDEKEAVLSATSMRQDLLRLFCRPVHCPPSFQAGSPSPPPSLPGHSGVPCPWSIVGKGCLPGPRAEPSVRLDWQHSFKVVRSPGTVDAGVLKDS